MSLLKECEVIDKYWNDLLYMICKGEVVNMREIVKLNIDEFFSYVENFTKELKSK